MTTKTIQRRLIGENPKFDIFFDDLEDDIEGIIKNYLVVKPKVKSKNGIAGVGVLPIIEGKICLIKMYRHATGTTLWEMPRGFVDSGEEESTSAIRELKEEAGLECSPDKLVHLGVVQPTASTFTSTDSIFVATDCKKIAQFKPAEIGHSKIGFFSTAEVDDLIAKGEIRDATTLVAYYRFRLHHPLG